ncbi:hypothetical protein LINGRAHAP2_LOCUS9894 [Linum grandiflorum]
MQAKLDRNIAEGRSVFAAYRGSSTRSQFNASQQFYSVNQSTQNGEGDSRCHHCNETCHFRNHCRKRNFCTYCKKIGHIILDCARAKGRRSSSAGGSDRSGGGTATFRHVFAAQSNSVESVTASAANSPSDDRIN